MQLAAEILISFLLVGGGIFGFSGSFGLIKLPNLMMRLHSPTKTTTLGVGGVLVASVAHSWLIDGKQTWHEILIALFLIMTAPITANFIAKAYLHRHREEEEPNLPPTGAEADWATFEDEETPVEPVMTRPRG